MTTQAGKNARARRYGRRLAALAAAALALVLLLGYALPWLAPAVPLPPLPQTLVTDRNGAPLGILAGADHYRCHPLPAEEPLPDLLVRALIAAEDGRFHRHGGVDLIACARALYNRAGGGPRSGASTLAMQLAKLAGGADARTMGAKLTEMAQARCLTMRLGREGVLREYLDRVDFGNLCHGAEAASLFYFGCRAHELSLPQAALLAALVQAPTRLNPLKNPQDALARRNAILRRMGEGAAMAEPLGVAAHSLAVPRSLAPQAGQLTLDAGLQRACRLIAEEELEVLRAHHVSAAAIAVLDNRSGELLAAVGPVDMPRSAGSTLKPFAYLQAFSHGAWPGTVMPDVPTLYPSAEGIDAPSNYLHRYLGPVTIRQALACSQNIPAMEALKSTRGVREFIGLLRRFGYRIEGSAEEYGLGLAIGNAHVTLLEQLRAYAALARGGELLTLHRTLPHDSEPAETVLLEGDGQQERLPLYCFQLADILSDPVARLEGFGYAPALRFPFRCAVKTGTSSNYRDNWCVGFTAEYTVGVWVGNLDNSQMQRVSGVSGAGPMFHRVFEQLAARQAAGGGGLTFPAQPQELVEVTIDRRTGMLPRPDCPEECRVTELAIRGSEPTEPGRHDAEGRALLGSRYGEWLGLSGEHHLYALDAAAPSDRLPMVLIPAHGVTITLDPALPEGGSLIELKSTLPEATARWHCDTLSLWQEDGRWWARLTPGTHRLQVDDPVNHLSAHATFIVEDEGE